MKLNYFKHRFDKYLIPITLLTLILCISMVVVEFKIIDAFLSIPKVVGWFFSNIIPTNESIEKIPLILEKLLETILLAITATAVASVFAILLSILGSSNTKLNQATFYISKVISSIFRNVPLVAWSMVLLYAFSNSLLTGFFALFFITLGTLTKQFIEVIEENGNESLLALDAVGASYPQTITQSVIPTCMPLFISWIIYNIETNVRSATLVGLLTGSGIGFLFDVYYKTGNYNAACLVIIFIIIVVLILEFLSNFLRKEIS